VAAENSFSPAPSVVALGGGHGLAVTLQALRAVTDRITAIVGVADDGGSSGRLRRDFGILPPGDLRMAVASLCGQDAASRAWADVLQYRFTGNGELGGHAVGNLVMAALWESGTDPVAGLDELGSLVGAVGRVLPCSMDPLEIVADIRGHDRAFPDAVIQVSGQVEVATTPGRVEHVRLEPAEARACEPALQAIDSADAIVLGPGSWFTSLMPHLLMPDQGRRVAAAPGRRILVLNLDPQEGETGDFSPAEHIEAIARHAPDMRFDDVIADRRHVGSAHIREDLLAACRSWGAEVHELDVAGQGDGRGDRHDPARLSRAFDTVLAGYREEKPLWR